jgi:hypothetical protein
MQPMQPGSRRESRDPTVTWRSLVGWIAVGFAAITASGCRTITASLPATQRAAAVADRFAQAFWNSNDDAQLDRLMSSRLKLMMRTTQLRGMRKGLIDDQGRVQTLGSVWYEDSILDLRRFRVPVEFTRTMVDMRIVVDESDKVSQFFIVDHVPPP